MNDYMAGSIETCAALARDEEEFVRFVEKSTGLTRLGIERNKFIQKIRGTFNREGKRHEKKH